MSEWANRLAHADKCNSAVADEATARLHLTLSPARIATRSVATGARVFGVELPMGSEAPERMSNGQCLLAKHQLPVKPQVQDSHPKLTMSDTISHQSKAVALVECSRIATDSIVK
jgi:hypothetical protein